MSITTEKELGQALKNDQETIEIEGDLTTKVLKIKATGKVAWAVAAGAIGVAVLGIMYPVPEPTTQVATKSAAFFAGGSAVAILGAGAAATAISIAVAAGGIGALNSLRKYKVVSSQGNKLKLSRK
ncbi:hypothetical protein [Stutzerimonas nitrititolerans]|uniref:hypothetical protein n=1 Tax=Stutzerimonas nitrititolerans TaxID=2482751 RepID=UPI0028988C04|nr:hypothetical protein [Stutzerimonas nitrititolerans]